MVVKCNFLTCNKDDNHLEDLGIKVEPEDVWLPCAIDFNDVVAITPSDPEKNEGWVRLRNGRGFVTDLSYEYAVHLFEFTRRDSNKWLELANKQWKDEQNNNTT